jgi:hypothetical protein
MKHNPNSTDITGDRGEYLIRLVLSSIANVNKPDKDTGLDVHCTLRNKEEIEFYAQTKGSQFPTYKGNFIFSLPIETSVVEKKWLKKIYPVFLFMVDTTKNEIYFLHITKEIYETQKSKADQDTIKFKIPLSNKLDDTNIGQVLLPIILEHKPKGHFDDNDLTNWFENYKKSYPLIFHGLNEIDSYLELLRSPNQDDIIKGVQLIKKRYSDIPKVEMVIPMGVSPMDFHLYIPHKQYSNVKQLPYKLQKGIIDILKISHDNVTQHHIIGIITHFQIFDAIEEIIKRIERNLLSYEFHRLIPPLKYTLFSFLFEALIELNATKIYPKIKQFLDYNVEYLIREVLQVVKVLKIEEAKEDVINLLAFGVNWEKHRLVRHEACETLAVLKFKPKEFDSLINRIINSNNIFEQASGIYLLALKEDNRLFKNIPNLLRINNEDILLNLIFYIGSLGFENDFKGELIDLFLKDNFNLKNEAHKVLHYSEKITKKDKEDLAIRLLKEGHEEQNLSKFGGGQQLLFVHHTIENINEIANIFKDSFTKQLSTIPKEYYAPLFQIIEKYNLPDIYDFFIERMQDNDNSFIGYINLYNHKVLTFELLSSIFLEKDYRHSHPAATIIKQRHSDKIIPFVIEKMPLTKDVYEFLKFSNLIAFPILDKNLELIVKEKVIHFASIDENRLDKPFLLFVTNNNFCKEVVDFIIDDFCTKENEKDICHRRLEIIGKSGTNEAKEILISLLKDERWESWFYTIIKYLGEYGDLESLEAIKLRQSYPNEGIKSLIEQILRVKSDVSSENQASFSTYVNGIKLTS